MGHYFEKASKNLLDAFQHEKKYISVWNGQKVITTTSDKLAFTFSHGDVDNMFAFSSVTYVLTESSLIEGKPTIYSGTNDSKIVTYIIPAEFTEYFDIENGPNVNRIICLDRKTLNKVINNVMSVI